MKKLISILLAFSFVLSLSTVAFAADPQSKTTNVTYTVNPGYVVTIPESVTLGNTETVSASEVSVAKGEKVVVRITATSGTDNAFTVRNTENAELSYTITDGASATYGINDVILEVAPTDTAKGSGSKDITFTEPADIVYAGTYTGTVTFTVSTEAV